VVTAQLVGESWGSVDLTAVTFDVHDLCGRQALVTLGGCLQLWVCACCRPLGTHFGMCVARSMGTTVGRLLQRRASKLCGGNLRRSANGKRLLIAGLLQFNELVQPHTGQAS
jgi:hypothetical protein